MSGSVVWESLLRYASALLFLAWCDMVVRSLLFAVES